MQKNTEQIKLENDQIEVIVNYHGAELRSLKKKATEQEYLWNADAKYWGRTSPVLFPFVGGVKNKVYRHEGKEYPMNQHGFARDMEFSLVSQSADEVWFALEDTEETYKVYPFHFHLEIGYRLEDASVSVLWKVKNINDTEMHFAIGAHPAFFCPLHEGEKQSAYYLGFRDGQGKAPEALVIVRWEGNRFIHAYLSAPAHVSCSHFRRGAFRRSGSSGSPMITSVWQSRDSGMV